MKIQYASDLHLEFKENTGLLSLQPLDVKGDILVLAGDIHVMKGLSWKKHPFFDWCVEHYEQTYIIPGNHEYYGRIELTKRFENYECFIRDNVRYINNRSIIHESSELFFTTLWSIIPVAEMAAVQLGLTDCHRIKYRGVGFTANGYKTLHQHCIDWLSGALEKSNAKHRIVVTHHQPTLRISDSRFVSSPINSAFAVNLDYFIEQYHPEYWIYGHTHYNGGSGKVIAKTKLLCNQMGYVRHQEHKNFRFDAVIALEE